MGSQDVSRRQIFGALIALGAARTLPKLPGAVAAASSLWSGHYAHRTFPNFASALVEFGKHYPPDGKMRNPADFVGRSDKLISAINADRGSKKWYELGSLETSHLLPEDSVAASKIVSDVWAQMNDALRRGAEGDSPEKVAKGLAKAINAARDRAGTEQAIDQYLSADKRSGWSALQALHEFQNGLAAVFNRNWYVGGVSRSTAVSLSPSEAPVSTILKDLEIVIGRQRRYLVDDVSGSRNGSVLLASVATTLRNLKAIAGLPTEF